MIATPQSPFWFSIDVPNGLESWDGRLAWVYECFTIEA
jgi:hypothetical protein